MLNLLRRDRNGRRDAQHAAKARVTAQVGPEAMLVRLVAERARKLDVLRLGRPVGHNLDASHEPAPAHLADAAVARHEPLQALVEQGPDLARVLHQVVALDNLEDLVADGRDERVVEVRRVEEELVLHGPAVDLLARHHGAQGQAVAERLGEGEDVRHDALVLDGHEVAAAADACLRLVDNQEHSPRLAVLLERREVAGGQDVHAAGALDALDDAAGERAARLQVDLAPAVVKLGLPVVRAVGLAKHGAVGVGRGEHQGARHERAVAASAKVKLRADGLRRDAVPGGTEADDLELARDDLGELDGGLVALAARREEEGAVESLGEHVAQPLRQVHHGRGNHA